MAAYRRVDDLQSPTDDCLGSAPGPMLGMEYWKPLPFLHGGECIRPLHMLGRHIRPRQQVNNAQCTDV